MFTMLNGYATLDYYTGKGGIWKGRGRGEGASHAGGVPTYGWIADAGPFRLCPGGVEDAGELGLARVKALPGHPCVDHHWIITSFTCVISQVDINTVLIMQGGWTFPYTKIPMYLVSYGQQTKFKNLRC